MMMMEIVLKMIYSDDDGNDSNDNVENYTDNGCKINTEYGYYIDKD